MYKITQKTFTLGGFFILICLFASHAALSSASSIPSSLLMIESTTVSNVKLFGVSSQAGFSTNEIYRYDVSPSSSPVLDYTITDPSLSAPFGLTFSPNGEMFVVNRGASSTNTKGFISRFLDPTGIPSSNGRITSPNFNGQIANNGGLHFATFRNSELLVTQTWDNYVLRFALDTTGNVTPNGTITTGLAYSKPRGVTVNPTSGEVFVSQCCGVDLINRYKFDASGTAIPNGVISGGGLSNPHDIVFSPSGELFVANLDSNSISRFTFDTAGTASPHGQITGNKLNGPISFDFSPWGELFVSNHYAPVISRFIFDTSLNAIPNGWFTTPNTVGGIRFFPSTPNKVFLPIIKR